MKQVSFLLIIFSLFIGCVQKSYKQTVIYTLKVVGQKEIKSVGIRGKDKPLSWDYDMELKPIKKDSLYQVKVEYLTGYKVTEVKFTINGEYELQNQPNRRVEFSNSKVTNYNAVYNQPTK